MTDLGISLDEALRHYERRGLVFESFGLMDAPAYTAVKDGLRIVLQSKLAEDMLTYAGMAFPSDDIPENEMAELAELIAPEWDPVGGFVPTETNILRAEHHGICIRFVRVGMVKRCLFRFNRARLGDRINRR